MLRKNHPLCKLGEESHVSFVSMASVLRVVSRTLEKDGQCWCCCIWFATHAHFMLVPDKSFCGSVHRVRVALTAITREHCY